MNLYIKCFNVSFIKFFNNHFIVLKEVSNKEEIFSQE